MKNHLIFSLLLITFLFAGCNKPKETVQVKKQSPQIEERISRIIKNLQVETSLNETYKKAGLADRLKYYKTPGVSIAVINNGVVEWARGFGVKEWGKEEAVDENTLFQAGSVSKPVFALGVMRLKEKGILDLDTDINTYLTSWKVPANEGWQPKITFRQLLSHTAGLTVHGFPGYMVSEELPTIPQILNGESPANTSAVRVNILPGTQFRYAGGGTTVAQLAVSEYVKKPFPQLMQEEVFNVLNLENSTYEQPLPEARAIQAATAHPWKNQPVNGRFHIYPEMAAAGLWTTPTDLATIAVEVQKAAAGQSKLISKKTIEEMLTPQKIAPHIGIGFFLQNKGDSLAFEHGGWDEGFVTKFIAYKKLGKGAVIMINSNEGASILDEIIRAIAIEYNWPDYVPTKKEFNLKEKPLTIYSGSYVSDKGLKYTLSDKNGELFLEAPAQPALKLLPQSEDKFYSPYLNLSVEFEKKEKKIASLTIIQDGQRHILKKDEQPKLLSTK